MMKNKSLYEELKIEVVVLGFACVITESSNLEFDDFGNWNEDWFSKSKG